MQEIVALPCEFQKHRLARQLLATFASNANAILAANLLPRILRIHSALTAFCHHRHFSSQSLQIRNTADCKRLRVLPAACPFFPRKLALKPFLGQPLKSRSSALSVVFYLSSAADHGSAKCQLLATKTFVARSELNLHFWPRAG
jgi:hypothetical protein